MDSFIKDQQNPTDYIKIKVNDVTHISIREPLRCIEHCENKPCTYYCPTGVYHWNDDTLTIDIIYARCVECGACPYGCPLGNIDWQMPAGGYGVVYRHG
jgi:ferredoxin like protein